MKEIPLKKYSLLIKIIPLVCALLILSLFTNILYTRWSGENNIREILKSQNNKISQDLGYAEGEWNTSLYNNDAEIKKNLPLYIITSEGFIIDRKNAISGYLDLTDFKFASSFNSPQEITSPIGQKWRIYSKEVNNNNTIYGTVTVGYFEPEFYAKEEIDARLTETADIILSQILFSPTGIKPGKIDPELIDKKIGYEIVDNKGHLLLSNSSFPSYLDRSYTGDLLAEKSIIVTDGINGTKYLIYITPIEKSPAKIIGSVASGYPLKDYYRNLNGQINFSLQIAGIIMFLTITALTVILIKERSSQKQQQEKTKEVIKKNGKVKFDKEKSLIIYGENKMALPLASNQYYLASCIFSNLKKRWEYEEILKRMGENDSSGGKNWRKIYDAARAINEKSKQTFNKELIIFENKSFRINPDFLSA